MPFALAQRQMSAVVGDCPIGGGPRSFGVPGRKEGDMEGLALARAVHVGAVVVWIGGVFMVTVVVLPAIRRGELGADRMRAFAAIERRFIGYARSAVLLVGATGLYMAVQFDLWARFRSAEFWWMHAMVIVWLVFALVLFVIEPLGLRRRLLELGGGSPDSALLRLQRIHIVLLVLALLTILGAVAGSHGMSF